jgi:glutathione-independent formaldehyde dehydrogenase
VIKLDQAPEGYKNFDAGTASKFVIAPHGQLKAA